MKSFIVVLCSILVLVNLVHSAAIEGPAANPSPVAPGGSRGDLEPASTFWWPWFGLGWGGYGGGWGGYGLGGYGGGWGGYGHGGYW